MYREKHKIEIGWVIIGILLEKFPEYTDEILVKELRRISEHAPYNIKTIMERKYPGTCTIL
jgi:hypothetical protein